MYKKITGITVVALLASGAFFVTKTNAANDKNAALADLLKINVANAECYDEPNHYGGICLPAGGFPKCLVSNYNECDSSQP